MKIVRENINFERGNPRDTLNVNTANNLEHLTVDMIKEIYKDLDLELPSIHGESGWFRWKVWYNDSTWEFMFDTDHGDLYLGELGTEIETDSEHHSNINNIIELEKFLKAWHKQN